MGAVSGEARKKKEHREQGRSMGEKQLPRVLHAVKVRTRRRGKGPNLPALSSLCGSHLRHSSGMVLRDVTEYWMGSRRRKGVK